MHKCIRRARGEPRDPLKSHAGRSRPHCGCGQILRATCRVTSLSDGRAPSRPHAAAWGSSTEWRPRALKTEKVDSECKFSDIEKFQNTIQKPKLSALEDGECLKTLSGDIRRLQPEVLALLPRRRCPEALALLPRKKESIHRFPLNSFRVQGSRECFGAENLESRYKLSEPNAQREQETRLVSPLFSEPRC